MSNQQPKQQKDTIMKEFTFKEQRLIKMWTNETFTIEAETYEEAKKMFLNEYKRYKGDPYLYSDGNFEYLYDTGDTVQVELLNEDETEIEDSND